MYKGSIEERIEEAMESKDKIIELMKGHWTDSAIANYIGTDKVTIKRVRKKFVSERLIPTIEQGCFNY